VASDSGERTDGSCWVVSSKAVLRRMSLEAEGDEFSFSWSYFVSGIWSTRADLLPTSVCLISSRGF